MTKPPVYIVDDEPEIRGALALLLSTLGVETEEYASAEEFFENAPFDQPYCVLLDNKLPGLSGIELLSRLVERSRAACVIMMTGHGDVPTAVKAMRLGAYHFVEKPFDPEALLSVVEEALGRSERQAELDVEALTYRDRRATLTEREAEVFALLLEGLPSKAIAARLDITTRTAEHHRAAVLRKFEAKSLSALLRVALSLKP